MNELDIPEIVLTQMTLSKVVCSVKMQNEISNSVESRVDVREVDACALFNKPIQTLALANYENIITISNMQCYENIRNFRIYSKEYGIYHQKMQRRVQVVRHNITIEKKPWLALKVLRNLCIWASHLVQITILLTAYYVSKQMLLWPLKIQKPEYIIPSSSYY